MSHLPPRRVRTAGLTAHAVSTADWRRAAVLCDNVAMCASGTLPPEWTPRAARLPPELIRVFPPLSPTSSPAAIRWLTGVIGLIGMVCIAASLWLGIAGRRVHLAAPIVGGVSVLVGASIYGAAYWENRCYARRRAAFFGAEAGAMRSETGEPESEGAIARQLRIEWTRPGKRPAEARVREAVAQHAPNAQDAHVVCLGLLRPPDVGALHFEPEIITPTRFHGWQLVFVPIALLILGFWVCQVIGLIPVMAINLGSFGYLLAMGIGVGASWFWRTVVRPTYLRLAPGVIQVLEFRWRGAPRIRSYPMESGTLAIVQGSMSGREIETVRSLILLRADQRDEIPLHRMYDRARCIERAWQALLSTAPTPPLPEDGLVG